MGFDHLYFRTGDADEDMRRAERIAWCHYLRVSKTLASMPLTSTNLGQSRKRVEVAKADFARAWRALDEVSP